MIPPRVERIVCTRSIIPSTEFTHVTVFRGAHGRVASHLRVSRRWIDRAAPQREPIFPTIPAILRSRYAPGNVRACVRALALMD